MYVDYNGKGVRYNMNKRLIINFIKAFGIAVIVFSLIISSIISQDEHHLEVCHEDNCTICQMIVIARTIVELTTLVIMVNLLTFIIYFILSRMHKSYEFFLQNSLILQKVQLNN